MMDYKERLGREKGEKLIAAIKEGKIKKDNRTNHGKDFYEGYEQLHKERFHRYLGSCSRYLDNQRLKERVYYG
ncbi:MAG: hypothetical protein K2M78_05110 [Lachnospiraceae bacterium]|nr:hypothetical protein [Lachnospiraceae bacterium]